MRSLAATVLVLLTATQPIWAQAPTNSGSSAGSATHLVGGLGVGGGTLGVAGQASMGVVTSMGDVFLRATGTTEFDLSRSVNESSTDVGLLYGFRLTSGGEAWLRAAAGPALVRTVVRGPRQVTQTAWSYSAYTEREESSTLGAALQFDVAWGTRRAVGLSVLANLNGQRSFGVATVSIFGIVDG